MVKQPRSSTNTKSYAGIDVGGTKIHIQDTQNTSIHRYSTNDHKDMYEVLDEYFAKTNQRPTHIVLAMAGPRDDETGDVKLTNAHWPTFSPAEATKRYPGITFETVNDMAGTAAGVLTETGIDIEILRPGTPAPTGTKLIMAISTGVGSAAAVWDKHADRHIFMASEGGHVSLHPKNADELDYLQYLQNKYPHVSVELALSGKYGVDNLVEHFLAKLPTDKLKTAIENAKLNDRPVGAVLHEIAEKGTGADQKTAQTILRNLGNMLGSVLRDYTIAFKATGGVYLTGSVALALGEYFAEKTNFLARFATPGADADVWVQKIPIYLVTDPNVAVKGALSLANDS